MVKYHTHALAPRLPSTLEDTPRVVAPEWTKGSASMSMDDGNDMSWNIAWFADGLQN